MEGKRQAKIARLIQKELSEIFRRQTAAMGNVLVSVSTVRVSPDLSIAKVYLSIFPPEKSNEILKNIQKQTKTVRYELAAAVRETLTFSSSSMILWITQRTSTVFLPPTPICTIPRLTKEGKRPLKTDVRDGILHTPAPDGMALSEVEKIP